VAAVLLTACNGGDGTVAGQEGRSGPMRIEITPAADARDVAPDAKVKVVGINGRLVDVRVTDGKGRDLEGAYSPDHSSWTSTVPVKVDARYTVHAWGTGPDGAEAEQVSRFGTDEVARTGTLDVADVQPADGDEVGVGEPLIVTFNQPVADRAIVQRALRVRTVPPVKGAWYWIDNVTVDYRPEKFWPAHTRVTLEAKLQGISAGDGVIGGENRKSGFTVGRSQVMTVDVKQHKLTVVRDGRPLKTFDVSTGKPGWETRNGTKVIMDKERNKVWTNDAIDAPEDYRLKSKYAMRVTNSGEFVHDAPWNTGNIGETNTSHGCIGLFPKDMAWLWKNTIVGDPVVVTGSPKAFDDLENRIADWNIPWATWVKGNTDQQL
jgi:lipoprotein-anchoring transpeptidase ErfK/SrfK